MITANTYSTARHVLESIDLGGEVKAINTEAVQSWPKEARDNAAKEETWIAGSISSMAPFQQCTGSSKPVIKYRTAIIELAEILAGGRS